MLKQNKIIITIVLSVVFGCTDHTVIQNNDKLEEMIDYAETNGLDSINYKLYLNGNSFSHLDEIKVSLDIINFSTTQRILIDIFYAEYGLKVLDSMNKSPVLAYWESYVSRTFDSMQEVQARKIAINPQNKMQISFWLTKKLDFDLRNKNVPKGEYYMYYKYQYRSAVDSSFVIDSTSNIIFFLERNSGKLK